MRSRIPVLRLRLAVWAACWLAAAGLGAADNAASAGASAIAPRSSGSANPESSAATSTYVPAPTIEDTRLLPSGSVFEEYVFPTTPVEPLPIYFPPEPPVLGVALPATTPAYDDTVSALLPFLNEPFYAPLSTRLAEDDLGRRQRAQLDTYRREKSALLAELRGRLAATSKLDATERERALTELAEAQAPALAALEVTAEQLRRDLYRRGLLGGGGDWNEYRTWRLGEGEIIGTSSGGPTLRELAVLRAAIYYQEGLSSEQRRLLREVVMEMNHALMPEARGPATEPAGGGAVVFFSPETIRIAVPADAPAPLGEKLAAYTAEKNALKRELREQIVLLDRERNVPRRARALQDFARLQAPRIAELERQAESIRREFAALPDRREESATSSLPPTLVTRIAAYLRAKNDLQRAAQAHLAATLREFEKQNAGRQRMLDDTRRAIATRAALARFHEQNKNIVDQLNNEGAAIRAEAARALAAGGAENGPTKSVDALLNEFGAAFRRQQLDSMYAEYRIAAFEPGLSPEQRRLLFDGALVALNPPGAVRDRQMPPEATAGRP